MHGPFGTLFGQTLNVRDGLFVLFKRVYGWFIVFKSVGCSLTKLEAKIFRSNKM